MRQPDKDRRLQARHGRVRLAQEYQEKHVQGDIVEVEEVYPFLANLQLLRFRLADADSRAVVACADKLDAFGFTSSYQFV